MGPSLDGSGRCCPIRVDACGQCGGSGVVVDVQVGEQVGNSERLACGKDAGEQGCLEDSNREHQVRQADRVRYFRGSTPL